MQVNVSSFRLSYFFAVFLYLFLFIFSLSFYLSLLFLLPPSFRRRLHTNTAYAHLWGFTRLKLQRWVFRYLGV